MHSNIRSDASQLELSQRAELLETLDYALDRILSSTANNGMIVNDDPNRQKHMLSVEFVPISNERAAEGYPRDASLIAELPDRATWKFLLLANENMSTFYSSQDGGSFIQLTVGDELPFRQNYFIWAAEADPSVVWLTYGSVHLQTRLVDALLAAYGATGTQRYLETSRQILLLLVKSVEPDGRFYVLYADQDELKYKGRIQALVMYALWNYSQYDDDPVIWQGLKDLAETFAHTTEGTFNHRTSSNIGQLITNRVLENQRFDENEICADLIDTLDNYEEDGNLSKNFRSSPKYPNYQPTYLSYDAMLLMRASQFTLADRIYETVFPLAFEMAVRTMNDGQYLARNLASLYYAKKLQKHVDERVPEWIEASTQIESPPKDVWETLGMLEICAWALALDSLCVDL